MVNFYNSPALARELNCLGFDCVGTLRTNRQFVPTELMYLSKGNLTDRSGGRESRERSRSPLRGQLPMNLSSWWMSVASDDEEGAGSGDAGSVDDFMWPDAHALFVRGGGRGDTHVRGRSRGRGRGRRGVRGRGMRTRNPVGSHQWEVGHPLNEIWTSDADVPSELSLLAREVVSRRQRANDDEDEFLDASDGSDSLLEGQDATSPMDSFCGEEKSFKPDRTGSTRPFASAYDAFRAFWDDDILYATKIASSAFQSEWFDTNLHEILCLFALSLNVKEIHLAEESSYNSKILGKYAEVLGGSPLTYWGDSDPKILIKHIVLKPSWHIINELTFMSIISRSEIRT
ncbi:hypothetical protein ABMA28_009259 [Loxostege sticticalis]|uniref:Uncharacterized protein n=1 Tax=Loxostege sticticalis TaxID=481309 RepID=A0ABD0SGI9_LOXSC